MGSDRSPPPDIAKQNQQQQIESEHLFKSLLEPEELATGIFNKASVSVPRLCDHQIKPNNKKIIPVGWASSPFRSSKCENTQKGDRP